MIVRIYRWQERQNRFHCQKIHLEESTYIQGEMFFGAIFDARQGMMPGFKNFRTQKVDRLEIDSVKGEISVYCSAVIERKENKSKVSFCAQKGCDSARVKGSPYCGVHTNKAVYGNVSEDHGTPAQDYPLPSVSNSEVLECTCKDHCTHDIPPFTCLCVCHCP